MTTVYRRNANTGLLEGFVLQADGLSYAPIVNAAIDESGAGTTNGVVVNAGGAVGEVQASPTANTVLDRLKALLTGIVLAAGSAIIGKVGIDQTTPGTTNGVVSTGNVASAATDSGNPVKVGGVYQTTLPVLTTGQRGDVQLDTSGGVRSHLTALIQTAADAASNLLIGYATNSASHSGFGPLATAPFKFNGTSWDRDRKPNATKQLLSAGATTNADFAKASAGDLFKVCGKSARGSDCYLKLYNKASAPTVGSDTPVLTLALPANASFDFNFSGQYFATGIAFAITTAAAVADTGALTAGDIVCLNLTYA